MPSMWFYQKHVVFTRNSIAYMLWQFRLSVCPSVRPSITQMDQSKTIEARIVQFSPYTNHIHLVGYVVLWVLWRTLFFFWNCGFSLDNPDGYVFVFFVEFHVHFSMPKKFTAHTTLVLWVFLTYWLKGRTLLPPLPSKNSLFSRYQNSLIPSGRSCTMYPFWTLWRLLTTLLNTSCPMPVLHHFS